MPTINATFSKIHQKFKKSCVSVMSINKFKLSGLHKVHKCHLHLFFVFKVNELFYSGAFGGGKFKRALQNLESHLNPRIVTFFALN